MSWTRSSSLVEFVSWVIKGHFGFRQVFWYDAWAGERWFLVLFIFTGLVLVVVCAPGRGMKCDSSHKKRFLHFRVCFCTSQLLAFSGVFFRSSSRFPFIYPFVCSICLRHVISVHFLSFTSFPIHHSFSVTSSPPVHPFFYSNKRIFREMVSTHYRDPRQSIIDKLQLITIESPHPQSATHLFWNNTLLRTNRQSIVHAKLTTAGRRSDKKRREPRGEK
jgi:hypothetical protein